VASATLQRNANESAPGSEPALSGPVTKRPFRQNRREPPPAATVLMLSCGLCIVTPAVVVSNTVLRRGVSQRDVDRDRVVVAAHLVGTIKARHVCRGSTLEIKPD
jgi:hypothetical protein